MNPESFIRAWEVPTITSKSCWQFSPGKMLAFIFLYILKIQKCCVLLYKGLNFHFTLQHVYENIYGSTKMECKMGIIHHWICRHRPPTRLPIEMVGADFFNLGLSLVGVTIIPSWRNSDKLAQHDLDHIRLILVRGKMCKEAMRATSIVVATWHDGEHMPWILSSPSLSHYKEEGLVADMWFTFSCHPSHISPPKKRETHRKRHLIFISIRNRLYC